MTEAAPHGAKVYRDEFRNYGRIPAYGVVGVLVILALAVLAILSIAGLRGPAIVPAEIAFWFLGFAVWILAAGLIFVLFTLRSTMRLVRYQATEVAILRSRPVARAVQPAPPTAPVEYRTTPTPAPANTEAPTPITAAQIPSREVQTIEGIGPVYGQRLERNGIETLRDLRAQPASRIAKAADVPTSVAQKWKCMADLMILPDVDAQAAEILYHCRVDSVDKLAKCEPQRLYEQVRRENHAREHRFNTAEFTRNEVATWVSEARTFGQVHNGGGVQAPPTTAPAPGAPQA